MDLSEGHIEAIVLLDSKESIYEVINLGSGQGYSVFQMIREFELSTGCEIPFLIKGRRNGEVSKYSLTFQNREFTWMVSKKMFKANLHRCLELAEKLSSRLYLAKNF